ncbi:protein lines isoform X2 [Hyalella azteca]|uniref:Protein lines isoform X2 n=1 Tax=Hyalella azteca TaxID=294128 RepID=A0A8B7NS57_HYAAZ|nr:protein lines isoform X2 [Hyalella azteca]
MVEPQHKRVKLPAGTYDGSNAGHQCVEDVQKLLKLLYGKCLCSLPLPHIVQILHQCNAHFSVLLSSNQTMQDTDGCLLYASMLSLFFDVALKQRSRSMICSRISEVVKAGADLESHLIEILLSFLASENQYISYTVVRAIVSLLLLFQGDLGAHILKQLVETAQCSENWLLVSHSFDIIRRIIDWRENDEHSHNDSSTPSQPGCTVIKLTPADVDGAHEFKSLVTKTVGYKWRTLVGKCLECLNSTSLTDKIVVVSFLNMWISLISVKNNLKFDDTKLFFNGLDVLVDPLTCADTPLMVWERILHLLNEVLCYGSTLALQEVLDDEPCLLAQRLIRDVNTKHLLDFVPCEQPAEDLPQSYTDTSHDTAVSCRPSRILTPLKAFCEAETGFQSLHIEPQDQFREIFNADFSADQVKDKISDLTIHQCSKCLRSNDCKCLSSSRASDNVQQSFVIPEDASSLAENYIDTNPVTTCERLEGSVTISQSSSNEKISITPPSLDSKFPQTENLEMDELNSRLFHESRTTVHSFDERSSTDNFPINERQRTRSPSQSSLPYSSPSTSKSGTSSAVLGDFMHLSSGLQFLKHSYNNDQQEEECDDKSDISSSSNEVFTYVHKQLSQHTSIVPHKTSKSLDDVEESNILIPSDLSESQISNQMRQISSESPQSTTVDPLSPFVRKNCTLHHLRKLLFRKTVLLVLKSVAVTVKEARGDSSSSSSEDSSPKSATQGSDTEEAEMEIICKSLQEVLAKTDAFVKRHKDYHPNCPIAEWMVKLFSSHDDWMVEAMVCGMDIHSGLANSFRGGGVINSWLCPHTSFLIFLDTVRFDSSVLLELLISNETCFLLYLLRYLKLVKRSLSSAESLQKAGSNTNINLHAAVQTMFTLRHSLKKLVAKELFPYNIAPILRLLDQCCAQRRIAAIRRC